MDWLEEQGDDAIATARLRYPILNTLDMKYSKNYQPSYKPVDRKLEYWSKDEIGSKEYPRPKDLPIGTLGIELLHQSTRPIDILGDVVSHHLVKTDPKFKQYYTQFESSLTPTQKEMLQQKYEYAKQNFNEKRPYEKWSSMEGLPDMFRGYAFEQWENAEQYYTPAQMRMFDKMTSELKRR